MPKAPSEILNANIESAWRSDRTIEHAKRLPLQFGPHREAFFSLTLVSVEYGNCLGDLAFLEEKCRVDFDSL